MGSTAVVVVHRGIVVDQWGEVTRPINVRSMRKSLLSALIGMAVAEGRLSVDKTLADLAIDDRNPALSKDERTATVRDLLTSRSGVYHDAAYVVPGGQRPARGSHPPGSFFFYNNWDFNALGTIYERASGRRIFDAFEERIARPLQFQDFERERDTRYLLEDGSVHPAYLFSLTARDLARFGWLYARGGRWAGRRLISEAWLKESTTAHVPRARAQNSYGYLWWVNDGPRGDQRLFWAAGAGGQFVLVAPALDLVVVHLVELGTLSTALAEERDVSWGEFFQLARALQAAMPR
jgi:CubicO group peptidase (beta-lactamase class C family)